MMAGGREEPHPRWGTAKKTFVAIVWFGAAHNRRLLEFIFGAGND